MGFLTGLYSSKIEFTIIYNVTDAFIEYLREIEPKVQQNKNGSRSYVVLGIVINGFEYYVPFTSPKIYKKGIKKPKIFNKMYHAMEHTNKKGLKHLGSRDPFQNLN